LFYFLFSTHGCFQVSVAMAEIEIDNLTLEEYLDLTREEQGSGLVRAAIGDDVQFEIKN
jgi:hypothetical protein